ncbi:MAG: hypothetical protein LBS07_06055 [Prevotellaceae bacterium]|jgi:hypothetical protein|nr:hypothetical protein [Prevotellaceae bacterium]
MIKKWTLFALLAVSLVSCGAKKAQQEMTPTGTDSIKIRTVPDTNVVIVDTICNDSAL